MRFTSICLAALVALTVPYVLHCFQKKSPSGVRTAKRDVELIGTRLRDAREHYERQYGKGAK